MPQLSALKVASAQKSAIAVGMIKRNDVNMLDRRFCIAPMMDWIESLLKSNIYMGVVYKSCACRCYYSFLFVLTKLQPAAAKCHPSCTACFVGAVRAVE